MAEGMPQGQQDNPELRRLIRELESQIEDVNAGLNRIRGTVARISYASLGTTAPAAGSMWGTPVAASPAAPANRADWQAAPAAEATASEAPSNGFGAPANESPSSALSAYGFGTLSAPEPPKQASSLDMTPFLTPPELHPETESGFWDSVAEGASWPRAHTDQPEATLPPIEENLEPEQTVEPQALIEPEPAVEALSDEPAVEFPSEVAIEQPAAEAESPVTPVNVEEPTPEAEAPVAMDATAAEAAEPTEPVPDWDAVWQHSGDVQVESRDEAAPGESTESAAGESETPLTAEKPAELPSSLTSGWPDESAWSQSFEWPAMKQPEPVDPIDQERHDVSDIVAQVKAELEAARRGEAPMPEVDWGDEPAQSQENALEGGQADSGPSDSQTASSDAEEDARREEVSRVVAEMRGQLEAGKFEDVLHGAGRDTSWLNEPYRPFQGEAGATDAPVSGEERVDGAKPAFRLAAPGSIPDWTHMSMEPSGPPMVVMKDTDGRVELASVYETLNELGCGSGAALLNYTPHSVTVGLAATTKVPSREDMAAAVEKVFGLTSRVESDGVRLTVNIGVDPKRKSEDAA